MEQIESDIEYVRQAREVNPKARFNWLYLFPILGVVWLLFLISAAIFQFPINWVVGPIMTLMIVLLFVMAGLLFWAMAPQTNRE